MASLSSRRRKIFRSGTKLRANCSTLSAYSLDPDVANRFGTTRTLFFR
jgi:hypothetical protein